MRGQRYRLRHGLLHLSRPVDDRDGSLGGTDGLADGLRRGRMHDFGVALRGECPPQERRALEVAIDEKHVGPALLEGHGQVGREDRLAGPAFLIEYGENHARCDVMVAWCEAVMVSCQPLMLMA